MSNMNPWIEYTGSLPSALLTKVGAGGVALHKDGYWWHQAAGGKVFCKRGAGVGSITKVGAGYVPLSGNYVVDAATAESLVEPNGGWTTIGNNLSLLPAGAHDEGERYLNSGPTSDVYIWFGDTKKIYQIDTSGDFVTVGDPGASFDPVAPPGVTCVDPQVWDPIQKKCVTPAGPSSNWFSSLPMWAKIVGGVALGGGLLFGAYELSGTGKKMRRRGRRR